MPDISIYRLSNACQTNASIGKAIIYTTIVFNHTISFSVGFEQVVRTNLKRSPPCFSTTVPVSRSSSSPVPGVVAFGERPITARTAPHVTNRDDACRMQIHCRARSSRLRSQKEE